MSNVQYHSGTGDIFIGEVADGATSAARGLSRFLDNDNLIRSSGINPKLSVNILAVLSQRLAKPLQARLP
jgi:hypothetical protein